VTLRKVPGALALGLLASLVAHTALYGDSHAMGGAYHEVLAQAAFAGGLGLALFFGALAWNGSSGVTDGSVLAARLREWLPSTAGLWTSVAGWYFIAEALEPHHAGAPSIGVVTALATAGWLVLRLARTVADALAGAVIAVLRAAFTGRTPSWWKRPRSRPLARRTARVYRRFARPPPIAIARAEARVHRTQPTRFGGNHV
jgi:hypothetical protein